jgi:hypothetical protein
MSKNWIKYNGKLPTQQIVMIDQKEKVDKLLKQSTKNQKDKNDKANIEVKE